MKISQNGLITLIFVYLIIKPTHEVKTKSGIDNTQFLDQSMLDTAVSYSRPYKRVVKSHTNFSKDGVTRRHKFRKRARKRRFVKSSRKSRRKSRYTRRRGRGGVRRGRSRRKQGRGGYSKRRSRGHYKPNQYCIKDGIYPNKARFLGEVFSLIAHMTGTSKPDAFRFMDYLSQRFRDLNRKNGRKISRKVVRGFKNMNEILKKKYEVKKYLDTLKDCQAEFDDLKKEFQIE